MSDRYYEPSSENDDYPDWYPVRMRELMKEQYSPANFDNFVESITEASDSDKQIIAEMLDCPNADIDYKALGRKLFCIAYERMERFAENHAIEDWEKGNRE
jgi:hypothetical protein